MCLNSFVSLKVLGPRPSTYGLGPEEMNDAGGFKSHVQLSSSSRFGVEIDWCGTIQWMLPAGSFLLCLVFPYNESKAKTCSSCEEHAERF